MIYPVRLQGFESQVIEVQSAGFLSGQKLLVNGQSAPKGKKRGEMILRRDNGQEVVATWKPQALGFDIAQLTVDGQTIQLVEPLAWYQWVWSALPILLVFVGGAFGGIAGIIGLMMNLKILRTDMDGLLKFVLTSAVSIIVVVAYVLVVILLSAVLG